MVNSASQALAEFKSQRMGGLLGGYSSRVNTPSIVGTSLSDSASDRLARSAPKKSSSAFMDNIRKSGERQHQTAMLGYEAKRKAQEAEAARQAAAARQGGGGGYSLPGGLSTSGGTGNGKQAYGGRYGLQVNASNAFTALEQAYSRQFGGGIPVVEGYRDYANQVKAWNNYQAGGPKAAKPGTSLHGSGTAIDLGGAVQNQNSAQHAWLRQNAAQFGWYWVGQRYGEPWHWEYHPNG